MALILSCPSQTGTLLRPSLLHSRRRPPLRRCATAPILSLHLPMKPQTQRAAAQVPPSPIIRAPALTGSTRTVTTLFALALALSKALLRNLSLSLLPGHAADLSLRAAGPLFFAAAEAGKRRGLVNTPMAVVAAGIGKWLDIYSGVLMIRVLLSWFPNIPWDRQPLSAIRDLCDPYLNLFRNIMPPVFDTLDVSPLLAFGVLGVLGVILGGV